MSAEVLRQAVTLRWRGTVVWAAGLAALVTLYAALWPSIRDQPSLTDLMDAMPEVLRSLLATTDLSTPVGYVQAEVMGLTGPLLVTLYAIVSGAAAIAGEESRHRLGLVLAAPVGRGRLVVEQAGAVVLGTLVLAGVVVLALLVSGAAFGLDLPAGHVVAAGLHLGLLGAVFGALALGVGAATGSRVLARAVPGVLAVLAYLLNGLAPLVGWLEPLRVLSPFWQSLGHQPLLTGLSVRGVVVCALAVVVLTGLAVPAFARRDVAV
ncbi:ABC transporter permease subunit [Geodermatophilus nigrescens]